MISTASVLNAHQFIDRRETGASTEAAELRRCLNEIYEHFSFPRMSNFIPAIEALQERSFRENETGIDSATASSAITFACLLPKSLPLPEIAADPDGEIAFDWLGSSGRVFSVSVNGLGRLAYAG